MTELLIPVLALANVFTTTLLVLSQRRWRVTFQRAMNAADEWRKVAASWESTAKKWERNYRIAVGEVRP